MLNKTLNKPEQPIPLFQAVETVNTSLSHKVDKKNLIPM